MKLTQSATLFELVALFFLHWDFPNPFWNVSECFQRNSNFTHGFGGPSALHGTLNNQLKEISLLALKGTSFCCGGGFHYLSDDFTHCVSLWKFSFCSNTKQNPNAKKTRDLNKRFHLRQVTRQVLSPGNLKVSVDAWILNMNRTSCKYLFPSCEPNSRGIK